MADTGPHSNEDAVHTPVINEAMLVDVHDAVAQNDSTRLFAIIDALALEDFADLIELSAPEQRDALLAMVKPRLDPAVLPLLDDNIRDDVVDQLDSKELAHAVSAMESDDAVGLIGALDQNMQREVLSVLTMEDRDALRTSLSYPDDSAGRLMQQEFMAVPDDWNVQQAVDHIRARSDTTLETRPDAFYDVFVVNRAGHALGGVPLHRLLTSRAAMPLSEIMDEQSQRIPVLMDQREVAYIFRRYALVSAPVENETRKLVGMITIDDVIDIMEERATEELVHLSGVSEPDFYHDVMETAQSRFKWLFVNLLTAIIASLLIGLFQDALKTIVTLAILMPIVASQGGNAGTQTLAVAVRSLALKELSWLNAWRFLKKEMSVGALNGFLFGVIVAVFVGCWYHEWMIALVIALAMMLNLMAAALAGTIVPLILHRLKVDPAISSSALVTFVTDTVGFAGFLGLATLLLIRH